MHRSHPCSFNVHHPCTSTRAPHVAPITTSSAFRDVLASVYGIIIGSRTTFGPPKYVAADGSDTVLLLKATLYSMLVVQATQCTQPCWHDPNPGSSYSLRIVLTHTNRFHERCLLQRLRLHVPDRSSDLREMLHELRKQVFHSQLINTSYILELFVRPRRRCSTSQPSSQPSP